MTKFVKFVLGYVLETCAVIVMRGKHKFFKLDVESVIPYEQD